MIQSFFYLKFWLILWKLKNAYHTIASFLCPLENAMIVMIVRIFSEYWSHLCVLFSLYCGTLHEQFFSTVFGDSLRGLHLENSIRCSPERSNNKTFWISIMLKIIHLNKCMSRAYCLNIKIENNLITPELMLKHTIENF